MRRVPHRPPAPGTERPIAPDQRDHHAAGAGDRAAVPDPAEIATLPVARVLLAPVLVQERICRVVAPVRSLLEVQEWIGEYWLPSQLPLYAVRVAPPATPEHLRSAGVPPEEWGALPAEAEIVSASQLLLVAMLMSAEARAAEPAAAGE